MKLIKGDLFSTNANIIAHGVNCSGGFGSGVAAQISKKYPEVKKAYMDRYKRGLWELGDVQFVYIVGKTIANIATQQNYGYDGKCYVSYTALEMGFTTLLKYATENKLSLSIPKIGCGLAGGSWEKVLSILTPLAVKYPVEIEIYYL